MPSKKHTNPPDLSRIPPSSIDFSKIALGYEGFRQLAQNPLLAPEERIGFPTHYRRGHEAAIIEDILRKLPIIVERGKCIVDIGCGVGALPESMHDIALRHEHRLVLVDSPEMLKHHKAAPDSKAEFVGGKYPDNAAEVAEVVGANGADVILCYSVLHYIFVDSNPFSFLDHLVDLLAPGGAALVGDIPNASKRRRFFASKAGIEFHKKFTGTFAEPEVEHFVVGHGKIDDAVLAALVSRAQAAGCNAYVVPQAASLPMANRRDDLLIIKP